MEETEVQEQQTGDPEVVAAEKDAESGTAQEPTPEKPVEGSPEPAKDTDLPSPEEIERRRRNREEAERRIERKRLRDLELENARLSGMVEAGRGQGGKTPTGQHGTPQAQIPALREPDPNDYDTNAEYIAAIADHKVQVAIRQREEQQKIAAHNERIAKAREEHEAVVNGIIGKGREEFPDFDDVTSGGNLPMTPVMANAIIDTGDIAHRVEYHLGRNPKLAAEIAQMTPVRQVKEIAKIEDQIRRASQQRTSSAPPPARTVQAAATAEIDDDQLTDAEYFARADRRRAEQRKGKV